MFNFFLIDKHTRIILDKGCLKGDPEHIGVYNRRLKTGKQKG